MRSWAFSFKRSYSICHKMYMPKNDSDLVIFIVQIIVKMCVVQ